uniref:Immunoglobulin V-set domain-containing protein n=1 Tax=Poecilia latipinna TaxID=48699 RepID=A0A3B3U5V2_9TELE
MNICSGEAFCVTGDAIIPVFGYEGSDAEVPCPYPVGYEDYEKYLCKNDCKNNDDEYEDEYSPDDDVPIRSEGENNKYSIYHDQEALTFTVTISDLRFDDAGKYCSKDEGRYWCGVTKTGFDKYPSEVSLEVKKGKKKIKLYMWRDEDCFLVLKFVANSFKDFKEIKNTNCIATNRLSILTLAVK